MGIIKNSLLEYIEAKISKELDIEVILKEFEESEHPRWEEGDPRGGQFKPKNKPNSSVKPHEEIFNHLSKRSLLNPSIFEEWRNSGEIKTKTLKTKRGKIAIGAISIFYSLLENKEITKKIITHFCLYPL